MTDGRDGYGYGAPSPGVHYGPPIGGLSGHQPVGTPPPAAAAPRAAASAPGWSPTTTPRPRPVDDAPPDDGLDSVGGPPTGWLYAATALGAVGALVAASLGDQVGLAVLAWALAGPFAIGLIAVFVRQDVMQRARPIYTSPTWMTALYGATLLAAAVGIAISAWRIAEWAGHL